MWPVGTVSNGWLKAKDIQLSPEVLWHRQSGIWSRRGVLLSVQQVSAHTTAEQCRRTPAHRGPWDLRRDYTSWVDRIRW